MPRPPFENNRKAAAIGVAAATFFAFAGVAANQFHGYLFELKGSSAMAIGFLLMTGYSASVFAPLVQMRLIRKSHGPYRPLLAVSFGAALALGLMPWARGFWDLWLLFATLSFCISSVFPLLTAATLETTRHQTRHQGHGLFVHIRGLGSAGFMVACLVCLAFPRSDKLAWIYAGFGLAFLISVAVLFPAAKWHDAQREGETQRVPRAPKLGVAWRRLFRGETSFLIFLIALMNFANVMATVVQGNYLIHRFQVSQGYISLAWVIATACEVVWMAVCARLVRSLDIRRLIVIGLWGTGLKLAFMGFASTYFSFVLGLVFHGLYFSFTLAGFGIYLDRRFRPSERPVLQALTSAMAQGLPAALAGLATGWLWHRFQLHSVYIVAAALGGLTCLFAEVWAYRRRVYFRSR